MSIRYLLFILIISLSLSLYLSCSDDDSGSGGTMDAGISGSGGSMAGTSGSTATSGAGGIATSGSGGTDVAGTGAIGFDAATSDGSTGTDAGDAGENTDTPTDIIYTASGPVRGTTSGTVRTFMGIPFAATTGGENRWKPPQPVESWSETLEATAPGPICPQNNPATRAYDPNADEDCLYLNVWTPDPAPTEPVPVMVWIFPGAYIFGSGSEDAYNGSNLVATGGVVVVTINYRLGALGLMAHSALTAESPDHTSGNYTLQDQQAALRWVQKNITFFGGDKNNVTIFGESAGANSSMLQLVTPGSKGLFHKAIIQSGLAGLREGEMSQAEATGARFAQAMGCTQTDDAALLACLRGLTAEQIFAGPEVPAPVLPGGIFFGDPDSDYNFRPIVDGTILPDFSWKLIGSNQTHGVPVIHGTNTSEGALFNVGLFGDLPIESEEQYLAALTRTFGTYATDVAAQYPYASYPSGNAAIMEVSTDYLFVCGSIRMARKLAEAGISNYLYSFNLPIEASDLIAQTYPDLVGKAFHSADIPFIFGNGYMLGEVMEVDQPIAESMVAYWTRFAHTGNPNGGSDPVWPAYDASTDQYLDISNPLQVASGLKSDKCEFWTPIAEGMFD